MIEPSLSRIVIDPQVEHTRLAANVRRNAGGIPVSVEATESLAASTRQLPLTEGKRLLLLRRYQGRAMKLCQGWKSSYACCNLHTLAEANNCAMECTYCILQFYMNSPHLTLFGNVEDLQAEIAATVATAPARLFRIGTGELADSLLLDPLGESTRHMVPFFRGLENGVLELKTKTDNIDHLLDMDAGESTVVSWSLNPPEIVRREEFKTAPLEARLEAARRLAESGYPIGFHLDPMIYFDGWEEAYRDLVERLLAAVPSQRIAWISLGTLRFPPEMKATMAARFPRSTLRSGEFTRAADGKFHYLRPMRVAMYRHVVEQLGTRLRPAPQRPVIYLCMEPPDVWKRVFGAAPTNAELEFEFAFNYAERFPRAGVPAPQREDYERFAAATAGSADGFVPAEAVRTLSS